VKAATSPRPSVIDDNVPEVSKAKRVLRPVAFGDVGERAVGGC